MATTIDTSSNPLAAYGYDSATGQKLAQSLGITTQQLAAALATTPQTGGGQNMQGGQYGKSAGVQLPGADQGSTIQQLQAAQAAGMGAGQAGQAPVSTSSSGGPFTDATNAAGRLGAAALGMPQIINPTPGQIPQGSQGKGGVAQVASPIVSSDVPTVPQGPWTANAGVFANQGQIQGNQVYAALGGKENLTPAQSEAFRQYGVLQGTIPGQGPATGGTPTGVTPANAPGAGQPATPWATAPAAPTVNTAVPAAAATASGAPAAPTQMNPALASLAHTSGLEQAGKAIYAHYGGDPDNATHADIANFHDQLQSHIQGVLGGAGGPVPGANYTAGVNQPPNTSPPVKMASGGWVPGNRDDQRGSWGNQQSGQQQQRQGASQRQQGQGSSQWQPPSNLPSGGNLQGWTPTPPAGGPSPMQPQGMPGNLPGISGGPPAFGSAPGTPPPLTLPPWQGGQGGQGGLPQGGQGGLPPANIMGTTPGGAPPPSPMQFQGMPGNLPGISGGPPAFGSAPMTPPNITPPPWQGTKQMATGGFVPGRGNGDTVPALLTPGEYVIPKQQAAHLFGQAPIRMAGGGYVPDDQKQLSPEARHAALVAAAQGQGGQGGQGQQPQQQSSGQSANPSPSDYQGKSPSDWAQIAQQARAAQTANAQVGSGGPGSIDSLGNLGDESIITGQGGPGQPGGPGSATMAASGAISDLANGLTKAAQTYAASFKPWQIQPSHIPTSVPNYQTTSFKQNEET